MRRQHCGNHQNERHNRQQLALPLVSVLGPFLCFSVLWLESKSDTLLLVLACSLIVFCCKRSGFCGYRVPRPPGVPLYRRDLQHRECTVWSVSFVSPPTPRCSVRCFVVLKPTPHAHTHTHTHTHASCVCVCVCCRGVCVKRVCRGHPDALVLPWHLQRRGRCCNSMPSTSTHTHTHSIFHTHACGRSASLPARAHPLPPHPPPTPPTLRVHIHRHHHHCNLIFVLTSFMHRQSVRGCGLHLSGRMSVEPRHVFARHLRLPTLAHRHWSRQWVVGEGK